MSKAKVIISAQYYENYGFYEGGVAWKPKGERKFEFEVDDTDLFDMERIESFCAYICQRKTDDLNRFEYVDHEVQFHEARDVNVDWNRFKDVYQPKAS